MSSACAYRDGNTDGPMYDSNGKKCDTMNHTTKMLLIAGCSAAGAALVALGIYWLIRRARISRRSSQSEDGNNGVPARPLSAWVHGQPGTMATTGGSNYQYDTDGVDYQKYAARSRASSYMNTKAPDGSYSPVLGVGYAEEQQGLGYVPGSPSGSSMQQQQQGNYYMQQQQQGQVSYDPAATPTKRTSALNNNTNRRSYYDFNQQQHQPRGLPVPPQSAAMPPRRYSQTSQEQDLNGDVYQYNYNYDNQDGRVRSPSPSRNRAASPSAYYAHRQSREYDQGYAYDGQGQGMEEEGRERVEMLSPDLRYIQPGR
ncbi:hypothetical protein FFLO_01143 [Filobasidium floriforme]|uniref:Uncharacterized protein n=1 Tax=Filobasidium floriforme TaxID=5210 RepID=A0A8K0JQ93_9TREE|nr:uncharacterized protein HD553DRAFT_169056 [Filobasidium floriforme]KAG7570945.1 hypothetical protein FFLO_01143 [Filobasidium floriforme]KAH8077465.1 hypothetical protein HD553DRAFT_169056 [Filobasidium floriforme]